MSKVGESEKAIAQLFEKARKNAPSIIFLDEIDSLFRKRDSDGSGELSSRLFAQIVVEIDLLSWDSESVMLLGATNHLELLDPALFRPGIILAISILCSLF